MNILRSLTSAPDARTAGTGRTRLRGALALGSLLALFAVPVSAQDPDDPVTAEDGWHFTIAPYLWATGMEGTISFEGTPDIPVDASFSDIWENLDLALSLHFEGRNGRWGFAVDGMYFKIGANSTLEVPIGPGDGVQGEIAVDLQETLLEGFGFYRLTVSDRSTNPGFADAFVGFRYVGANQEVTTTSLALPRRELSWTDAVFGLRGYAPLGDRFGVLARGDIAGFGSNFTWSLKGDLHWRMSDRWRLILGYKYMDVDFEEGEGLLGREVYQMKHSGPEFAVSFSW